MALPSISVDDFIGEIRLSKDQYGIEDANDFIAEKYPEIIRKYFGDYAYSEIRDTDPLPSKWSDLLNGVTYTDSDGLKWVLDGMVKACKYLLWCDLFAQDFQNTPAGNVVNNNENSTRLSGGTVSTITATRGNKANGFIYDCYCFLEEFKKISVEFTAVTDNADNTYTFEVPSTKYLAVGDKVFCSDKELTVTGITEDTDITADAGSVGLPFVVPIYWLPYEKYKMPLPSPNKSAGF